MRIWSELCRPCLQHRKGCQLPSRPDQPTGWQLLVGEYNSLSSLSLDISPEGKQGADLWLTSLSLSTTPPPFFSFFKGNGWLQRMVSRNARFWSLWSRWSEFELLERIVERICPRKGWKRHLPSLLRDRYTRLPSFAHLRYLNYFDIDSS